MAYKKDELRLKTDHLWKARPGCKILVADKGAVRFDIPEAWIVIPDPDCIKAYDKQPPADDCVLAVSYLRLPPVDWSGLPLSKLLTEGTKADRRNITQIGKVVERRRGDLEIAWREDHFMDEQEPREAISRTCLGRRKLIQSLITFDFWLTDLDRCNPVWKTVLETLTLSEFVNDPTTGR